jgi:hypothetical protein
MGEVTLKVRVKAIDEVSPMLKKLKGGAASLGGGLGKAGSFIQSPVGSALAGGALGGGIVAFASALQGMITQVVDIAKKIFSTLVESSGILTQVSKMWSAAIMEVFRPIGDMLGLAMMPAMLDLNKTTALTYAEFLQNVRNGMDINEALGIATDENTTALTEFITSVVPAFEGAMGPLTDLLTTMIETMGPAIAQAVIDASPEIAKASYKAIMEGFGKGVMGIEPDLGTKWLQNDPWGHSTIGSLFRGTLTDPNSPTNQSYQYQPLINLIFNGNVYGQETVEEAVQNALDANNSKLQAGGV